MVEAEHGHAPAPYVKQLRKYLEDLPRERFPHMVALAGALTSGTGDERFEFGLDLLVRGLMSLRTG